jgi:hypothetical protein
VEFRNHYNKKIKTMKNIFMIIFLMGLFYSCSTEGNDLEYDEITNFEEAKARVDYDIAVMDERYKELCGGVRNLYVKDQFYNLGAEITEYRYIDEEMSKLDFTVQREVSIYCINQIEIRPHFEQLCLDGNIECW